ncbi:MAG: hypothetical protein RIS18_184 [Actinomycetota bacterium]|jgi:bifunctional N-acetylglucosamine-1-phosphate-uridyltransferase/glucosamine-1-phosphate-acetyltransferase GlmU-like protein
MSEHAEEPVTLIIAAAGLGTRLNSELPKGLTKFKNSNFLALLLEKTSHVFDEVIVVCNEKQWSEFNAYKASTKGKWKLCHQNGGKGSFYAVRSGTAIARNRRVVVCWVDQVGLDSQIFSKTKNNIIGRDLAFPVVYKSKPYVQAIIESGKLQSWKFTRENDQTSDGYSDCGIFGINKESLEKFITNCPEISLYQSPITNEINFLSILPDFQKNQSSRIWEEDNQAYVLAVNTLEELEQAEKLL